MKNIILIPALKILSLFKYRGFPLYYLPDAGMGSHKKYLKFLLENLDTTNPVLVETGSGDNSTGLFVKELKNKNYSLYSFENHKAWHDKMARKYKNVNSQFIYIEGKSYLDIKKYLDKDNVNKIIEDILSSSSSLNSDNEKVKNSFSFPLKEARENFEKEYLSVQLKKNHGNISKTADLIGMERSALHRKLKSLGIKGIN